MHISSTNYPHPHILSLSGRERAFSQEKKKEKDTRHTDTHPKQALSTVLEWHNTAVVLVVVVARISMCHPKLHRLHRLQGDSNTLPHPE